MKRATFILAVAGFLTVGATLVNAQNQPAIKQTMPHLMSSWDTSMNPPAGQYRYWSAPRRYYYHRPVRYYYYPLYVGLYPPVQIHYYANPFPGYSYYPNGFGYRNY
jgi:hypothetical protein